MSKKRFLLGCVITASCLFSTQVLADTGKIVETYFYPDGVVALRLDGGLPQANVVNNCGTPGNQWAAVPASASSSIKGGILAAKISGSTVAIYTLGGCVGGMIKIEFMSIQ